ncbi:CRTAC1 family protein [bacterium]|nr:CRTAC1 family protein [bacterium]
MSIMSIRSIFVLLLLAALSMAAGCSCGDDDDDDDNDNVSDDDAADDDEADGDDDDDDDDDAGDDDSVYECVDEATVVESDEPGAPIDREALYASICPDATDPAANVEAQYALDDGVKKAGRGGLEPGDIEAIQVIAPHPFHVTSVDLYFFGGCGDVIVRLLPDVCGSEPDRYGDLITPIRLAIPEEAGWVRVELPPRDFWRYPADKFWVAYEHVTEEPLLGVDGTDNYHLRSRYYSADWAAANAPFQWGVAGHNYMVRANGYTFCEKESETFTDVTTDIGLPGDLHRQRTVWADIDGDGWDDIVVSRGGYDEEGFSVYHNDEGMFVDVTDASGLNGYYAGFSVWADFDNDGDIDVYLGVNTPVTDAVDAPSTVLLNDGTGVFTEKESNGVDVMFEGDRPSTSAAAAADYNGDGVVDLYVGNWLVEYPNIPSFPDVLFAGNGDGTFTDVTDASAIGVLAGRPTYGVTWTDYNNDGLADIFVSEYGRVKNVFWENQGDGTFVNVADDANLDSPRGNRPGNTFASDFGDIDNDGDLDAYLAEISHPRYQPSSEPSSMNLNSGAPDFFYTEVTDALGFTCDEGEIDVSFVDFDNDGRLDVFLSDLYEGHYGRLYRQLDDGTFMDVTYWAGIEMHDCTNHAWGDFDRDGDLDLLVTRRSGGFVTHVFRNDVGQDNNWATFRLTGVTSNRSACGARVTLVAGDLTQIREVQCAKGHASSTPSLPVEFGLGDKTTIDEVKVLWPGGAEQSWDDPPVKRFIDLTEDVAAFDYYDD